MFCLARIWLSFEKKKKWTKSKWGKGFQERATKLRKHRHHSFRLPCYMHSHIKASENGRKKLVRIILTLCFPNWLDNGVLFYTVYSHLRNLEFCKITKENVSPGECEFCCKSYLLFNTHFRPLAEPGWGPLKCLLLGSQFSFWRRVFSAWGTSEPALHLGWIPGRCWFTWPSLAQEYLPFSSAWS